MKLRVFLPDGGLHNELELRRPRIKIGRDSRCQLHFDAKLFPQVSGLHAELVFRDGSTWLVHRSQSNATVVDQQPVEKPVRLRSGSRFRLGFTGPEIELVEEYQQDAPQTVIGQSASDILNTAGLAEDRFEVGKGGIIGRVEPSRFVLAHPHVSRQHAEIRRKEGKTLLRDLKSGNGTFINGRRIEKPVTVKPGDLIDIGPYSLVFDGTFLTSSSRAENVGLSVQGVSFLVPSRNGQISLLDDVSFEAEAGEFVAILGPSGSGKSTLLKLISGRTWPSMGYVYVNNRDLHSAFAAVREDLVVVPQAPAFFETLTVQQTLRFAATLRLPTDTSKNELSARTDTAMSQMELDQRADTSVSQLSGGQLKRLGLASELISDPGLLFLDEVTSGLDENGDRQMMRLFHDLADGGKTVVCVTHNLSHIAEFCHKVLVLTPGGKVAFFGTPEQLIKYFGIAGIQGVYAALQQHSPEKWKAAFRRSKLCQTSTTSPAPEAARELPKQSLPQRFARKPFSQLLVMTARSCAVWLGDRAALAAMIGQPALVTLLLCLVFGSIPEANQDPASVLQRQTELQNLLFLIGVASFWLGANSAAKEIVKERLIFERERSFNLIPESFLAAKVIVLTVMGIFQAVLLTSATTWWCGVPGERGMMILASVALSLTGTLLGLAISANSKTEELAAALVPVAVIPQIILGGVVASLAGSSLWMARGFTSVYWGQQLLSGFLPETDRLSSGEIETVGVSLAVLAVQILICCTAALVGVRFRTLTNA